MLSGEWRCSWSSTDRWCSNYIWLINNIIAYKSVTYIRCLTVHTIRSNMTQVYRKQNDRTITHVINWPDSELTKDTPSPQLWAVCCIWGKLPYWNENHLYSVHHSRFHKLLLETTISNMPPYFFFFSILQWNVSPVLESDPIYWLSTCHTIYKMR